MCLTHRVLSPGIEGDGAWALVQPPTAPKAMADSDHMPFKRPQHKESRSSCLIGKSHGRASLGGFVPSADHCWSLCLPWSGKRSCLSSTLSSRRQHECPLAVLCWHRGLRPGLSDAPSQTPRARVERTCCSPTCGERRWQWFLAPCESTEQVLPSARFSPALL